MILGDVVTFLGRMHPMVVHLPLGFLVLAFLFRLAAHKERYRHLDEAVPFILLAGTVFAIVACVLGYMLSKTGDYDRHLLRNHQWMGIALAIVSALFYVLSIKRWLIPDRFFTIGMGALFVLMLYTGHHGGMLTHGRDYLTLNTLTHQQRLRPASLEEAYIYEDVVQPILQVRCGQCHMGGKRKGGLSMETMDAMIKGGKVGHAIIPGDIVGSELIKRVSLNPADEKFMPTNGKTPLKPAELAIIKWWIEKGAMEGKKWLEIAGHDSMRSKVSAYLGFEATPDSSKGVITQKINPDIPATADSAAIAHLRSRGWRVRYMLHAPVMLDVMKPLSGDAQLNEVQAEFRKLARNIVWLDLSDAGLRDADLDVLTSLSNLEKLRLDGNGISDAGVAPLKTLGHLEAVNLNKTGVSPSGVAGLKGVLYFSGPPHNK